MAPSEDAPIAAAAAPTNTFSSPYMNGNVIDGKAVAAKIREETAAKVAELKAKYGRVPGLAVVIVGERKDSQTYVRMKRKACEEVGIASFGADLPATATQDEVLAAVRGFNANPDVHGILVQLPLPNHIDEQDMESIVRQADIIIAAAGQAQLVKGSWVKPGAAIIDVGTNPVDDPSKAAGYRLVGDAHFEECKAVAGAITPVPGGVGPMTIAMLLKNTAESGDRFITGKLQLLRDREAAGPLAVVAAVSLGAGVALARALGGGRK
ncbi:hypothetical protein GPECTOR_24g276 [Gonium pectorale]|uniref:methenyltetrahydrofolate cyclohydrolase n=1 Tax=Gonium pectorale TaxID=33097 RepID=A0A150GGP2_GONPE|nr:hypothetical protein GPECTOR_24g276 [Gonium pectorale]|eukprot:KXZ48986.1 hypothetical protein GPECTOR_24g276 [Gonium pectorale]